MNMEEVIHLAILASLIITATFVVRLRDLIGAAIAMGAFSLILSLEFFLLRAPDVAIAEAGVGAALTTAIFIMAIKATKRMEDYQ